MGKVVKCVDSPLPGVPMKASLHPQQPGEVLIRYEVEAAGGCQLNKLGWCCFGALLCTAFPISWLPFVCSSCKKHYQRPVYGYPMPSMSFITASDADASAAAKPPQGSTAAVAPTILCMDSSLELQALPLHDQQEPFQQLRDLPQERPLPARGPTPNQMQRVLASSPAPPPSSIFVPPSAVPACGFTADNPFPSHNSPVPQHRGAHLTPLSLGSSPTKVSGIMGPEPRSPGPSVGLPVSGLAMGLY
ncbi:hypothetical protein OEZ85_005150 [Tetradesmus obliquus]|uniref:LITAF domain-containing protein n=1 Tax=Tetradesmus obliquus TaxID=3088 RepID=A0ABY8UHN3_TETOB|nr:hypothetical protein OEZ85_005150 [Tetradesmus obliquus]